MTLRPRPMMTTLSISHGRGGVCGGGIVFIFGKFTFAPSWSLFRTRRKYFSVRILASVTLDFPARVSNTLPV